MGIRLGAILIFAAFLTAYVGFELSETGTAQRNRIQHSPDRYADPVLVSRTVVINKGSFSPRESHGWAPRQEVNGQLELSYGVVLVVSSILLLSGLMLVWPMSRYEATPGS